jgi:hypothetical protein
MSWKPSGLEQRQPRALVVGLRRIVKDPKASVRQRLRACELLAIIAGYIEGHSQPEGETVKRLKGAALPPTASRGNSNGLSRLAELARKLE